MVREINSTGPATGSKKYSRSANFHWSAASVLGRGATAIVYKGRHLSSGEVCAIKVYCHNIPGGHTPVAEREKELLRKLQQRNVITFLGRENEIISDNDIIAMEYCSGGSLLSMLNRPEFAFGLPEEEFIVVLNDTTDGLSYLRQNNIIHRDIKPGNILRTSDEDGGSVYKLSDFGGARTLHEHETFTSVFGTVEYLDPNVFERAILRRSDSRTEFGADVDLWSLGVTLYHTATGRLPFQAFGGRENPEILFQIMTTKEYGVISGIQKSRGGEIEWMKSLPKTCHLSKEPEEYSHLCSYSFLPGLFRYAASTGGFEFGDETIYLNEEILKDGQKRATTQYYLIPGLEYLNMNTAAKVQKSRHAFKSFLTPILAGLLESDSGKRWSFHRYFHYINGFKFRRVLRIVNTKTTEIYNLYIDKIKRYLQFQDLVEETTKIPKENQLILFNNKELIEVINDINEVKDWPQDVFKGHLFVYDKERTDQHKLSIPEIPLIPAFRNDVMLKDDHNIAHAIASISCLLRRYIASYMMQHEYMIMSEKKLRDIIQSKIQDFNDSFAGIQHDLNQYKHRYQLLLYGFKGLQSSSYDTKLQIKTDETIKVEFLEIEDKVSRLNLEMECIMKTMEEQSTKRLHCSVKSLEEYDCQKKAENINSKINDIRIEFEKHMKQQKLSDEEMFEHESDRKILQKYLDQIHSIFWSQFEDLKKAQTFMGGAEMSLMSMWKKLMHIKENIMHVIRRCDVNLSKRMENVERECKQLFEQQRVLQRECLNVPEPTWTYAKEENKSDGYCRMIDSDVIEIRTADHFEHLSFDPSNQEEFREETTTMNENMNITLTKQVSKKMKSVDGDCSFSDLNHEKQTSPKCMIGNRYSSSETDCLDKTGNSYSSKEVSPSECNHRPRKFKTF